MFTVSEQFCCPWYIFSAVHIVLHSLFAKPVSLIYWKTFAIRFFHCVSGTCVCYIRVPSPLPLPHFQVPRFTHRNSYQSVTSVITASSFNHTFVINSFAKKAWHFKALGYSKLIAAIAAGSVGLHEAVVKVWISTYPSHIMSGSSPWLSQKALRQFSISEPKGKTTHRRNWELFISWRIWFERLWFGTVIMPVLSCGRLVLW